MIAHQFIQQRNHYDDYANADRPVFIKNPTNDHFSHILKNNDLQTIFRLYPQFDRTGMGHDDLLWYAALHDSFNIVESLCENGVFIAPTVLNVAASVGNLDMIRYLCKKIENINDQNFDTVSTLQVCMLQACMQGHLHVVKFFHENGIDIHAQDDLALCYSSRWNRLETTIYLLQEGAKINFTHCETRFVKENDIYHILNYRHGKIELSNEIQSELHKKIPLTKNARS